MKKYLIILVAITIFALATACTLQTQNIEQERSTTFTLGFIPAESAEELMPKANRLAAYLEEKMDVNVEILIPDEYESLIDGFAFEKIDAAYMDAGPAWVATQQSEAEVELVEVENGNTFYFAEVFVHAESGNINSLKDVIGRKVAFTGWSGSSGFIFPVGTLIKEGLITPSSGDFEALQKELDDVFHSYIFTGGYKQSLDLLIDKRVEVAFAAHDAAYNFLSAADQKKVKSVQELGKVPSHAIVVGKHVPSDVKKKFLSAMMELNEPENSQLLIDIYGAEGLVEAETDEHLEEFGVIFTSLSGIHDKFFSEDKE